MNLERNEGGLSIPYASEHACCSRQQAFSAVRNNVVILGFEDVHDIDHAIMIIISYRGESGDGLLWSVGEVLETTPALVVSTGKSQPVSGRQHPLAMRNQFREQYRKADCYTTPLQR